MYQWKKLQYIVWFVTDVHWYRCLVFLYQLDIKRWFVSESILHGNQSLLHPCNTNSSNQHSHPGHSHLSQGATDTESQCEPVVGPGTSVQSEEGSTQARKQSHLIPGRHIDIRDYMTNPHRCCGDVISFLTQSSSQIGHTPSTKLQPQA